MKVYGLTTMQLYSASLVVCEGRGATASVYLVRWSERHGDGELLKTEYWKEAAPNMYVVMS